MTTPKQYLSLAGFAQRVGLTTGTLASYTRKGLMPPPDVIITDGQGGRETRGWTPATIDYWTTHRVGRGYRDDGRPLRNPHSVPERPSSPKGHPRSRGVNVGDGVGFG